MSNCFKISFSFIFFSPQITKLGKCEEVIRLKVPRHYCLFSYCRSDLLFSFKILSIPEKELLQQDKQENMETIQDATVLSKAITVSTSVLIQFVQ